MHFFSVVATFVVGIVTSISGVFHSSPPAPAAEVMPVKVTTSNSQTNGGSPGTPTTSNSQGSSSSTPRSKEIEALLNYSKGLQASTTARVISEGKMEEYSSPVVLPTTIDSTVNAKLDSQIYTTPKGVPIMRPPTGWKVSAVEDELYTRVTFAYEGHGSISFNVIPNGKDGNRYTAEEYISGEVDVPPYVKMIRRAPVTISGASGYVTEKTMSTASDPMHFVLFTLIKNGKVYQVGGSTKESEWASLSPLIYASLSTLQIQ
jgi:hypothetical protein